MSESRSIPKTNYKQEINWQELYILTEHWKNDVLFYRDDLRFLHHLIDKYFIWITKEDSLDSIQKVGISILEDSKECDLLFEKIQKHLSHLADLLDGSFKNDSSLFRQEHQDLEEEIALFVKGSEPTENSYFL